MIVQYLMRSEILDAKTCAVCAQLDGIILRADDPAWTSELGVEAHCNCRFILVPLYTELPTGLEMTPFEDVIKLKQYMGRIMTQELLKEILVSKLGLDRLLAKELTLEQLMIELQPHDEILRYLYPKAFI